MLSWRHTVAWLYHCGGGVTQAKKRTACRFFGLRDFSVTRARALEQTGNGKNRANLRASGASKIHAKPTMPANRRKRPASGF